jgi:hypothetical protein
MTFEGEILNEEDNTTETHTLNFDQDIMLVRFRRSRIVIKNNQDG